MRTRLCLSFSVGENGNHTFFYVYECYGYNKHTAYEAAFEAYNLKFNTLDSCKQHLVLRHKHRNTYTHILQPNPQNYYYYYYFVPTITTTTTTAKGFYC